ncbi:Uncharacterised protein [Nocardia otitidiscaviarum]|uniref:Uncharacterized protein n=1 Tax=Nocardia otitidiscaviarum TaxID=1823 RepID=A0A378YVS0_9NOCA|nr:hypothetical protein [Nocardia otitidiscaviarum]SUA80630.1 Uncharacterised protein [Nocardia otitidiscaviarum]
MIGAIAYLALGAAMGILVGWRLATAHRAEHAVRRGAGRTVAEIRARLDREARGRSPNRSRLMILAA